MSSSDEDLLTSKLGPEGEENVNAAQIRWRSGVENVRSSGTSSDSGFSRVEAEAERHPDGSK